MNVRQSPAVLDPPEASAGGIPRLDLAGTANRSSLVVEDPALAGLKWIAAGAMVLDHIDRYLFASSLGLTSTVGRVALPLFVFVLAYNMLRRAPPGAQRAGRFRHGRAIRKMLIYGLLATPATIGLAAAAGHALWLGVFPLNVMFSLGCCVGLAWYVQFAANLRRPQDYLGPLVLVGLAMFGALGALVEYLWWIYGLFGACAFWCRRPGWLSAAALVAALVSLYPFESTLWPVAALAPIWLASRSGSGGPWRHAFANSFLGTPRGASLGALGRSRAFFYCFYPAHLYLIWIVGSLAK